MKPITCQAFGRRQRLQSRQTEHQLVTQPKSHLGIRRRHLQKRSLPRKKFICALQMSSKQLSLSVIFR